MPELSNATFAELLREVRAHGLFRRQHRYYATKIALNFGSHLAGWTAFFIIGDSWLQVLVAGFLAATGTQSAIVAHDAGHWQITRSRRLTAIIGYVHMNATIGLSFGWWMERHRRHHIYPNHEGQDPDFSNGLVAFNAEQANRLHGWRRIASRHQAVLYLPALFLIQPWAMRINHARERVRYTGPGRTIELALLAGHAVAYLSLVFLTLPPLLAAVFVMLHQGLFATYLGAIIAPNHKGMTGFEPDRRRDFLQRQLWTSRNIAGGRVVEAVFGGLNMQIEHHLFPSMPIPNLRHAKAVVRSYCGAHNLPYEEVGLLASYRASYQAIRAAGVIAG